MTLRALQDVKERILEHMAVSFLKGTVVVPCSKTARSFVPDNFALTESLPAVRLCAWKDHVFGWAARSWQDFYRQEHSPCFGQADGEGQGCRNTACLTA